MSRLPSVALLSLSGTLLFVRLLPVPLPPPHRRGDSLGRWRSTASAPSLEPSYRIDLTVPGSGRRPSRATPRSRFGWNDPEGFDLVVDFKDPGERVHAVKVNGEDVAWRPGERPRGGSGQMP